MSSKQKAQRQLGFTVLKKSIVVNHLRTSVKMDKKFRIPNIKMTMKYKTRVPKEELYHITSIEDAYNAFMEVFNADNVDWFEEAFILCLNRCNKVIGSYKISQGGISGTIMDPKIIFGVALTCQSSAIIVAHNHPSGNLKPSNSDTALTNKLKEAGKLLDISVIDHLIISSEGFYSFAEAGKL